MNHLSHLTAVLAAIATVATMSPAYAAPAAPAPKFDAVAAAALFKENECRKCHNPEKDKSGPSFKSIAKKYKGKPDAEQKMIKHMLEGPRVKLETGKEEDHKIIDTEDPRALKNLAQWILSH